MKLNWLDLVILIPLVWNAFTGLKNGLIRELVSVAALVLGIFITVKFSGVVAGWLGGIRHVKQIALFLTFIATLIGVHLIGKLFENLWKTLFPGFINHLFGMLFGMAKVLLIASVLLFFVKTIDPKAVLLSPETQSSSLLYPYVAPLFPYAMEWVEEPTP